MGKRGKNQEQNSGSSKKSKLRKNGDVDVNDIDDEIDAFHKKMDMIPLDINADSGDSDEDEEQPVFDYKGIDGEDDDEDDDSEDEDDELDDDEDDRDKYHDKGLAKKIIKQQKYLKEKMGGVDDDFLDDAEEKEKTFWSKGKGIYYGDDNVEDDEAAEEEEEVIRLQKERVESLRDEDFGVQMDEDDSDAEPTLEELRGNCRKLSSEDKEVGGDAVAMYEEVKKDLNALSKDEQMDIVYSSAPELVGLLSELNDAVNELEIKVNPLLCKGCYFLKVIIGKNTKKEGMHYLEVKQHLLQVYCQAIIFYLLLKSEGQLVRDHPVIARLVELKSLLDKLKELDRFIPDDFEDALNEKEDATDALGQAPKAAAFSSDLYAELNKLTGSLAERKDALQSSEVIEDKQKKRKLEISSESVQMLQHRAALEDKLRLKSISDSDASRTIGSKKKKLKTLSGNLETTDDFDDDAMETLGTTHNNGRASTLSSKLSRILPAKNKKGVSGDDDLPERDNLGERRWKHELRVLQRAGIKSNDDDGQPESGPESSGDDGIGEDDGVGDDDHGGVDLDLFKRQRDLKLKKKDAKYSRGPQYDDQPDDTVDGKRYISAEIEKNRGLTRNRKKNNPRKNKREKYQKAVKNRKGQVREIKKPSGPYGGETTGINARVSRSIRFKN